MIDIKPKNVNFSSQVNSRDYYKGTSFRWAGEWEVGRLYSNDTYFVDFVSYEHNIWVCIKSNYASNGNKPSNDSGYWQVVIDSSDLIGPKGDQGIQGIQGIQGEKGDEGKSAYEIWLEAGNRGSEADFIQSLKGEKGDEGPLRGIHFGPESPKEYYEALIRNGNATKEELDKYSRWETMIWIDTDEISNQPAEENFYTKDEIDNFVQNLSGQNNVIDGSTWNN